MSSSQRLVYGIVNENQVLLPEEVAKTFATDHQALWLLETYGEARRFQPQSLDGVPGLDEDDYDGIPADADPYEVALTYDYENGKWPTPAATIALDELLDDLDDIGEQIEHSPSFPTLYIDPATDADLVRVLNHRGYEARRDDELINRIEIGTEASCRRISPLGPTNAE
jgi:hypothetical protein